MFCLVSLHTSHSPLIAECQHYHLLSIFNNTGKSCTFTCFGAGFPVNVRKSKTEIRSTSAQCGQNGVVTRHLQVRHDTILLALHERALAFTPRHNVAEQDAPYIFFQGQKTTENRFEISLEVYKCEKPVKEDTWKQPRISTSSSLFSPYLEVTARNARERLSSRGHDGETPGLRGWSATCRIATAPHVQLSVLRDCHTVRRPH